MKAPAKIYAVSEPIRNLSSSNEDLIIYNWATTETFSHDTEYIRRDVVEDAIRRMEWYASVCVAGEIPLPDAIIKEAIDNADKH